MKLSEPVEEVLADVVRAFCVVSVSDKALAKHISVVRATGKQLGIDDISKICWSNLYKFSPHAAGNPSTSLAAAQFDHCLQILKIEIEDWKSRRLLFLTGYS